MELAKWTITAFTEWEDLTEYQEEYLLDMLFADLDADMIRDMIGTHLEPYGIKIEVQDG